LTSTKATMTPRLGLVLRDRRAAARDTRLEGPGAAPGLMSESATLSFPDEPACRTQR
jgi:hypothetical protein